MGNDSHDLRIPHFGKILGILENHLHGDGLREGSLPDFSKNTNKKTCQNIYMEVTEFFALFGKKYRNRQVMHSCKQCYNGRTSRGDGEHIKNEILKIKRSDFASQMSSAFSKKRKIRETKQTFFNF